MNTHTTRSQSECLTNKKIVLSTGSFLLLLHFAFHFSSFDIILHILNYDHELYDENPCRDNKVILFY